MGWFGSLDLAFKYALIFGSALLVTLLLGVAKLLIDRRKMAKLLIESEVEAGRKVPNEFADLEVNMREKDEGDLFGIRAIEAGYYGGVAQSNPSSAVNSPTGSRTASPAPGPRTPKGHSASSSTTAFSNRPITPSSLSPAKKQISDSNSSVNLNLFPQVTNRPEYMQPTRPSNLRTTPYNSEIAVRQPLGHPPLE